MYVQRVPGQAAIPRIAQDNESYIFVRTYIEILPIECPRFRVQHHPKPTKSTREDSEAARFNFAPFGLSRLFLPVSRQTTISHVFLLRNATEG